MINEQWKPVVGYEGFYEVSDLGRVKSLERTCKTAHGKGWRTVKGRMLYIHTDRRGYQTVQLCNVEKVTHLIHRLVMAAFVGRCPDGMEVCHGDGNPRNNQLSNLRYDTHENNCADMVEHGTATIGENNGHSKLTEKEVSEIKWALSHGFKGIEIADYFGVSSSSVSNINTNQKWRHVNA